MKARVLFESTYDIEYDFRLAGRNSKARVSDRLRFIQHQKAAANRLEYFEEETKQKFIRTWSEPSAGVDRTVLALICEAYSEIRSAR